MLFNCTLALFEEHFSDINDINTDELRISQILALDENEIRKNWVAVEVPEKNPEQSTPLQLNKERHARTPNRNNEARRRLFEPSTSGLSKRNLDEPSTSGISKKTKTSSR